MLDSIRFMYIIHNFCGALLTLLFFWLTISSTSQAIASIESSLKLLAKFQSILQRDRAWDAAIWAIGGAKQPVVWTILKPKILQKLGKMMWKLKGKAMALNFEQWLYWIVLGGIELNGHPNWRSLTFVFLLGVWIEERWRLDFQGLPHWV